MIKVCIDISEATEQEIDSLNAMPAYLAFKSEVERFGRQRGVAFTLIEQSAEPVRKFLEALNSNTPTATA